MAANFFQQQDSARRKTFELVVYFVLAILILIALVYGLLLWLGMENAGAPVSWWQPEPLLLAAALSMPSHSNSPYTRATRIKIARTK